MSLSVAEMALLSRLLDEALPIDRAGRERWLENLAPEHAALAGHLRESLLGTSDVATGTGQFATLPKINQQEDLASSNPGDQIGPYRLLRQIGRGGMGSVWLAERSDGSLKRQVALKLPSVAWAPGMAERMRRERDILAALEHPHIARLYDAGVDAHGRPYLALEYVEGEPIDRYVQNQKFSVRQRLELFLQVTDAVAHAHARLVVHRDLKPSNILVNAEGQVQLLDFGIAKLLEGDSGGPSQLTELAGAALTPDYASPEQLRGEAITVATDVYSLGVVLYELLTGRRPYEFNGKTAAAVAEAMTDTEIPAASRAATDQVKKKALSGDLDTVLSKALKKHVAQRYPTVEGFAADVRRYLDGMPIAARPNSAAYRARKFVARHQLGTTGSLVTLIAILGTAAFALWQAHRAELEAQHAKRVQQFVEGLFRTSSSASPYRGLGDSQAELLLERGVYQIDSEFKNQPDLQAELTGVIARALLDLGQSERAGQQAQRQLKMLEEMKAPLELRVDALQILARAQAKQSLPSDEESTLRTAIDMARVLAPAKTIDLELLLVECLLSQRSARAEEILGSAEARWKRLGAKDLVRGGRIELLYALSSWYSQRQPAEIEARFQRALDLAEKAGDLGRALLVEISGELGAYYAKRGMVKRAADNFDRQVLLIRRINGDLDVAAALAELEGLARAPGRDVDDVLRKLFDDRRIFERFESQIPRAVSVRANFYAAEILMGIGDFAKSCPMLKQALSTLHRLPMTTNEAQFFVTVLNDVLPNCGEHRLAEAIFGNIVKAAQRENSPPRYHLALIRWASNLQRNGDSRRAEEILGSFARPDNDGLETVFEIVRAELDLADGRFQDVERQLSRYATVDYETIVISTKRLELLATARCENGAAAEGAALLSRAIAIRELSQIPDSPYLVYDRATLGMCLLKLKEFRRATDLAASARRAFDAQPQLSPYFKKPLVELERRLKSVRAAGLGVSN